MFWKTGARGGGLPGKRWSIARRLALMHICAVLISYLVFSSILYFKRVNYLETLESRELDDEIVTVRTMLREPKSRDILAGEMKDQLYAPKSSRLYLRIVDRAGRVVMESPGMSALLPVQIFSCAGPDRATCRLRTGNDEYFLLKAAKLSDDVFCGPGSVLQIAANTDDSISFTAELRLTLFLFVTGGLAFAFVCAVLVVRFGMKPVEEISRTAASINRRELHVRIDESSLPEELVPLAHSFNGMLTRLQDSFERLSHYSGNLAHELRTPLNTMMVEADIALSRERTPEEYRRVIASSLDEFGRLARVVDRMLFLARADVDQHDLSLQFLDVDGEVESVFDYYGDEAQEAGVTLEVSGWAPLYADQTLFRRALGNLISNALSHTPSGGVVSVVVRSTGSGTEVTVIDSGCGIEQEHLPRIFDRFYRPPGSELRNAHGSGLGLAIVKTILQLHRGTVSIVSRPGEGTRVTLCFPNSGSPTQTSC